MLVYYNETECICGNKRLTSLASSGKDTSYATVFGNEFIVPNNTKRIIVRESFGYLIERVFLSVDKTIYPIRVRMFFDDKVVVLTLKTGINDFTHLTKNHNVEFARIKVLDCALAKFIDDDIESYDYYGSILTDNSEYENIDNMGSSIRAVFADMMDDYCANSIYGDTINSYIEDVRGMFPMYTLGTLTDELCMIEDCNIDTIFKESVNFCRDNVTKAHAEDFIISWNTPMLPEKKSIDGYTRRCANDSLDRSFLFKYTGVKRKSSVFKPARTIYEYDSLLLNWLRSILELPVVQIGIRYILPKWDYEILYHDAADTSTLNSLVGSVAMMGNDVIPKLICPFNITDVVVEKTKDDMLIIRSVGSNADKIVIDLILASALDDGLVTHRS